MNTVLRPSETQERIAATNKCYVQETEEREERCTVWQPVKDGRREECYKVRSGPAHDLSHGVLYGA